MPISAAFVADFSLFNAAVDKAEVKLRGFEQGAAQVGRLLSRFADDFSGRKVIQDAIAMERAIAEVGGVTKLTAAELQRAGTAAQAAVSKMQALGVDVPPKLHALANAIKPVEQQLTLAGRAANLAKSSFGQMFSAFSAASLVDRAVSSLIGMGKAALDSAGQVHDLAAQTGLSTDAIQEMQFVAEQTGSSLETFSKAAIKLGINLSKGTTEAHEAVDKLGLSWEALQRQTSEEQFKSVLDALGKIEDTNLRNRLGVELLGKSFTQMGAAAVAGFRNIAAEGPKVAQAQIEALDAAGDAWDRFNAGIAKGFTTAMGTVFMKLEELDRFVTEQANEVRALFGLAALEIPTGKTSRQLVGPFKDPTRALGSLGRDEGDADEHAKKQREAAARASEKAAEAQDKLNAQRRQGINMVEEMRIAEAGAQLAFEQSARSVTVWNRAYENVTVNTAAMIRNYSTLPGTIREGDTAILQSSQNIEAMTLAMDANNVVMTNWLHTANESKQAAKGMFAGLSTEIGKQLGPAILGALQGGGNVLASAGSSIGGLVTGKLFGPESALMKAITSKVPGMIGGLASAVLPGIGALAGPAIQGISSLMGKVFKSEGKKTNDLRDEWIKTTFGTRDALIKLATEAGVTDAALHRLFTVGKVKDFETAAQKVTGVIGAFADEQAADAARLEAAIDKYGFAFEELGAKFQQTKLDERAKDLIEDWRVLVESGIDVSKVNEKMADAVSDFLKTAIKTGAQVPAAMRPILEQMVKQGTLTDAAGEKIESLEDTGVQFAETMTQGFDRVVAKLDELIGNLIGAGNALADIPDEKDITIRVHYEYDDEPPDVARARSEHVDDEPPESLDPERMPGFQHGTGGRYLDFGSGTPAMLHGKERIITPMESQTAADGVGQMVNAVAGLQVALIRAIRENALQMRDQALLARG
jgi:hypothetical protein